MLQGVPSRTGARVTNRRVFGPADWALFVAFAAVNLAAVALLVTRLASKVDAVSAVVIAPSLVALAGFLARWFSLPLMRVPEPMEAEPGGRVAAATTFAPGVEPLDMVRRTVAALVAMDHPHDTWVLDEGDDPAVRSLCEELGAHHFSRRHHPEYQQPSGTFEARTKHGNYNAWLDAVGYDRYDVIVGFDPDHVPLPSFLTRTLGYLRDDRVGYVQAAQVYYNQSASFVARGAAEESYSYYSSVQMTAHALGYPIVTGCHNVHRTTALRQVGGFAAHEADDLLITVHYRASGWRGVYVPEILAAGITPADWSSYVNQQRRWARSVLDVKLRVFPRIARQLPFVERVVSALHGLYYLYALSMALGVGFLTTALAVGWTPEVMRVSPTVALALLALVACDLLRQRYYLDRRREWGLHLRAAIVKFAKWPFVLTALRDAAAGRGRGYLTTPKVRQETRRVLLRAHGPAAGLVVLGGLIGAAAGHPPSGPVGVAAWVYVSLSVLVIGLEWLPAADPYDDRLAATWSDQP